jgi:pimeloyl-ACP methyl ester carboxylesterase
MIRRTAASLVAVIGVTPCHAFARPRTATALARPSRLAASRFCHRPLAMAAGAAEGQEDLGFDKTRLYPQPALQNEGMLAVSDLHTVAWFEYGNPNGKPVLFVHGGPGGGTAPMNARYFNAEAYRIILVDQRGCGKSTPFAELEENTTWDLVEDFEKLRQHLGVDTWQVFGGSWGSTLALSYAITHPERVTELVLRGIFLLRHKELDFFYEGRGTNFLFPEAWEAYEEALPAEERTSGNFIRAYGKRLRGELGDDEMYSASKAWSIWEVRGPYATHMTPPSLTPSTALPPTARSLSSRLLRAARLAGHRLPPQGPDARGDPRKVGRRRLRLSLRAHREPLLYWQGRCARLLPARRLAARGGQPGQDPPPAHRHCAGAVRRRLPGHLGV